MVEAPPSSSESDEPSVESEESSSEVEEDLAEMIIYRASDYFDRVEEAKTLVIGLDPGPKLCGLVVIGEFAHGEEVLGVARYSSTNDDGTSLEQVAQFAELPWGDWLPMMRPEDRGRVHVLIEKQEQRREKAFRQDNTVLIGVLAAGAKMYHVENMRIVSATVKLGAPMLKYCGMPSGTVAPRGQKNRLKRKKLAVEVFQRYTSHIRMGGLVWQKLGGVTQSRGIFDMCDAGLTAATYFKDREQKTKASTKKRKRAD